MKSLCVTEDQARKIEQETRQRNSPEWFRACRFRLTSSVFEEIAHRQAEIPPDALVMRLIEQRQITSPAIQWGVHQEVIAFQA